MEHPLLAYYNKNSAMGAAAVTTVSSTDRDYLKGLQILGYFHEESKKNSSYPLKTVQDLLNSFGIAKATNIKKGPIVAKGLGQLYRTAQMTDTEAHDAMIELSKISAGKIPSPAMFNEILVGDVKTTSFISIVGSAIADTAQQVSEVATATMGNLGAVIKILPWVALGLGAFIAYQKFGGRK